ncbi:hypothetical protein J31TS4_02180 [Paenibacillus sp. J31TS4]|nr:hypothetical protein J31TS4_02180 [Paenibacillus sp. J31TS4]
MDKFTTTTNPVEPLYIKVTREGIGKGKAGSDRWSAGRWKRLGALPGWKGRRRKRKGDCFGRVYAIRRFDPGAAG